MSRARRFLRLTALGLSLGPAAALAVPALTAHPGAARLVAAAAPPATIQFHTEPAETTTTEAPAPAPVAPPTTAAVRAAAPKPKGDGRHDTNKPDTRPTPRAAGVPLGTPFVGALDSADIEGYPRYEPQTTCDPTDKPGTVALRNLLLARYPSTVSFGISRGCDIGGTSEHKEGRAFDWGANVNDAADRAAVDDFVHALMATDAYGHKFALARRMGVMYVIWNNQIWGAYNADQGWRPYSGDSPHTDHVHISMSWAGGRGETSFWSGHVVPGLPGDRTDTDTTRPRRPRPSSTTTTTRRERPTTTTVLSTTSSTTGSTTTTSTWHTFPRRR